MKKNIIKTSLLILAILLSVGAILFYKHTVLDPPKSFDFKNAHNESVLNSIQKISNDSLESSFSDVLYKLARFKAEGLIGSDTLDLRLEDALVKYIPLFIEKSNASFSKSVWDTPDWSHSFMVNRSNELKNYKKATGEYVIERHSDYINQLDGIENIINRYNAAWQLARNTKYVSIEDTKSRVRSANNYKDDNMLKHCSALVMALDNLPNAIQNSHLSYLKNVSSLYCHGIGGYERYLSALKDVYNNKISDYVSYYGNNGSINEIRNKLISEQYNVLNGFVNYALNINNFYDYQSYSNTNTTVYQYIDTYLGGDADKQNLKASLRNGSLSEFDFNEQKYEY